MKKISRRLLLSTLTVVLTVIALGTTTFAWFTITNTARISSFETQVAAEEGIEVAIGIINPALLDAEETKFEVNSPAHLNWVTTLTAADIEEYIQSHVETGFRFDHLTSNDGRTFKTFSQDAVGSQVQTGFVKLPVHFRSGDVYTINWSAVSLSGTSPLPTWVSDVDSFTNVNGVTVLRGDTISVDPSNAIRISFDDGSTATVYEKPYAGSNLVLGTGGNLGLEVDPDNDPVTENSYIPQNVGAHSYYYAKTSQYPDGIDAVDTVSTITDLLEADAENGTTVLTLASGQSATAGMEYYAAATIYIWIEGWDPNAFNAILDEYINISFTFKGVAI